MLQLDVFSAYAICGAGALVGATLLRPGLSNDATTALALTLVRASFALLGIGLTLPVIVGAPVPHAIQALMALSALLALVWLSGALAALAGRPMRFRTLWLCSAVSTALVLAGATGSTGQLGVVCAVTLALAATGMVVAAWRLVWRPRDMNERLVGLLLTLTLPTYWLRVALMPGHDQPWPDHLLALPAALITPYALMYGVLPILFTMLVLNIVNARLMQGLHRRAMTDPLTGALSRHALADSALDLIARQREAGQELAVVMIDIDHFKRINDRHGHAVGDNVLRRACGLVQAQLRADALLVRYGGEEFLALVPVDDLQSARRACERICQALQQSDWHATAPGLDGVTASLGLALLGPTESLEQALARADEAMYRAKGSGRDQVQVSLSAA